MLAIQNYIIITGNTCFSEMKSLMVFGPEMAMFLYVTFRKCFKMKAFNRQRGGKKIFLQVCNLVSTHGKSPKI